MFGGPPVRSIYCTACSELFDVPASALEECLRGGDVVLSGHPSGYGERLYGVCKACQKRPSSENPRSLRDQVQRIKYKAWELLEWDLSLSREQAITAAVEEEFDARREPDQAFKAYLLER